MADPATAATAAATVTKQGTAAALPIAAAVGAVAGIPYDLLGYGFFGILIAEAKADPRVPLDAPWKTAARLALHLGIGAGIGGAFAHLGADVAVALAAKVGVALADDDILQRAAAIVIGFASRFLPDLIAIGRRRVGATP